jgi:hypothetical protein
MVTPEAPVKAVKRAQAKSATTAKPPGNHPISALETFTKRLGVGNLHQTTRGLAFRQDITGKGKEGDRNEHWCAGQPVHLDGYYRRIDAHEIEVQQCAG